MESFLFLDDVRGCGARLVHNEQIFGHASFWNLLVKSPPMEFFPYQQVGGFPIAALVTVL